MKTLEMMNACDGSGREFYSEKAEIYYREGTGVIEKLPSLSHKCLWVEVINEFLTIDDWEEVKQFTDDELVILKNLPEWAKWIARDENKTLCIYAEKPNKDDCEWNDDYEWESFVYNHLFQSIQWTDKEPTRIPER